MKDKLILKDGTEIELETGASLSDIQVLSATKADMVSIWESLTSENLRSVQVKNGSGLVVSNYADLMLEAETSKIQQDGSVLTSFALRPKTELELLKEELEAVKAGQEIQDGAIADLGEVVSVMAEQQEVGA